MAAQKNIRIDLGATFTMTVLYKDAAGIPIDITGFLARMEVQKNYGSSPVFSLSESSGLSIDGTNGRIDVSISAAATGQVQTDLSITKETTMIYDLIIVDLSGSTKRILSGRAVLAPGVTM